MSDNLVLGIDVGTSHIKAGVVSESGEVIKLIRERNHVINPNK